MFLILFTDNLILIIYLLRYQYHSTITKTFGVESKVWNVRVNRAKLIAYVQ